MKKKFFLIVGALLNIPLIWLAGAAFVYVVTGKDRLRGIMAAVGWC